MVNLNLPVEHHLKFKGFDLCEAVYSGRKPFEVRKNDRNYRVKDIIVPVSVDEDLKRIFHPIDKCRYRITYVMPEWEDVLKKGYCILGIKLIE